jgi:hypothetical protein
MVPVLTVVCVTVKSQPFLKLHRGKSRFPYHVQLDIALIVLLVIFIAMVLLLVFVVVVPRTNQT